MCFIINNGREKITINQEAGIEPGKRMRDDGTEEAMPYRI